LRRFDSTATHRMPACVAAVPVVASLAHSYAPRLAPLPQSSSGSLAAQCTSGRWSEPRRLATPSAAHGYAERPTSYR